MSRSPNPRAGPGRAGARPPPARRGRSAATSTRWPCSGPQAGHPAEASCRCGLAAEGQVPEPDVGVQLAHGLDQGGRGPGVQPLRPGDLEPAGRPRAVPPALAHGLSSAARTCSAELLLLRGQRPPGLRPRPRPLGPARRGDRRHAQPLDKRRRAEVTRSRRSGSSRSRASSAESTALPRSMRTTTPLPASAWTMASATRTASVPNAPWSGPPPPRCGRRPRAASRPRARSRPGPGPGCARRRRDRRDRGSARSCVPRREHLCRGGHEKRR